jgi:hypothetical protein
MAAVATFAINGMLFGEEAATLGVGWLISIPVGMVLAIACALIQKHSYKDETGLAVGKGLLIGLLTAIPTALPAFGLIPLAVLGAVRTFGRGSEQRQLETVAPQRIRE